MTSVELHWGLLGVVPLLLLLSVPPRRLLGALPLLLLPDLGWLVGQPAWGHTLWLPLGLGLAGWRLKRPALALGMLLVAGHLLIEVFSGGAPLLAPLVPDSLGVRVEGGVEFQRLMTVKMYQGEAREFVNASVYRPITEFTLRRTSAPSGFPEEIVFTRSPELGVLLLVLLTVAARVAFSRRRPRRGDP